MTRRPILTLLAVALTIAASVFLGALLAILVAFRLLLPDPAAAASRSSSNGNPAEPPRLQHDGGSTLPSPETQARSGVPLDPASVSAAASGDDRPVGAPAPAVPPVGFTIATPVPGRGPVASREPRTATTLRGMATWFCLPGASPCTAGYRSAGAFAAAGPRLRSALGPGWRGRTVTVTAGGRSVEVVLVDWCACPSADIDLYAGMFAALAPLDRGRITVSVEEVP